MNKTYYLEGLDCPSCAGEIEKAVAALPEVERAVVNFSSGRLAISVNGAEPKALTEKLQGIAAGIDPNIIVSQRRVQRRETPKLSGRDLAFFLGLFSFFVALLLPSGLSKNGFFALAYLLAGWEIIFQALKIVGKGRIFDENLLMAIATAGALAIGELPEAAAVMLFYRLGEFLEGLAVDHSRRSIASLMAIRPETAHRQEDDQIVDIPVETVEIGDLLLVHPGERIPVDATVLAGFSALDTSALTGESMPQAVEPGAEIFAGCINLSGLLTIKAQKPAVDSAISRVLDLVENAAANKAPTEDFITSFARYYTPAVVGIAALISIVPPLFFQGNFSTWFYRSLVFLVVSCPCALVVSIPLGFFAGIGRASRQGILIKGSNYLQALQEARTIIFDKTGTLTSGQFRVQTVLPNPPFSAEEVLEAAAHGESFSPHPIGRSIVEAYGKPIRQGEINTVEELIGLGVKADWNGKQILVGSRRFLEQEGIEVNFQEDGIYTAVDRVFSGVIVIKDSPKEGAAEAIRALQEMGKQIVMLTGDQREAAGQIAEELGTDTFYAQLLPEQKVEKVAEIIASENGKGSVVFVGDGINDAPALARAHVGIAMGALGSEAAIETADIVLMTDEPLSVVDALKTARQTNKVVWQNILLALAVKSVVLVLGALGFATLWQAVFADVGVTVLTVLNSIRIINPAGSAAARLR